MGRMASYGISTKKLKQYAIVFHMEFQQKIKTICDCVFHFKKDLK